MNWDWLGPHPVRNVSVFAIGTIVSALGAVMSTKSSLGVSPSSSIPYVCSLASDISLGTWTLIIQFVFFAMGFLIMGRRNYKAVFLLTIPTLVLYSWITDVLAGPLEQAITPTNLTMDWILIIIATAIHAFGIALQLASNLAMTPLDMFANFLGCRINREYGAIKVCLDVALVVIAGILSFIFLGKLDGVGLGTVFAALAVGIIVRYVSKLFVKFGFYEWVGHLTIDFKPKE